MGLPRDHQCRPLPKQFPAGTVYVVEGRSGQYGQFRVFSRYIVMPSGRKLEIPADQDKAHPAQLAAAAARRVRGYRKGPSAAGAKVPETVKKFAVVAGTAYRE